MKKFISFCISLLLSVSCYSQLSGTYTIGGFAPDYDSIHTAIEDMALQGISGPVTFNIRDGVYTERIIIPSIPGASTTKRIIIQSESMDSSAVTIQYLGTLSTENFVIMLDNADYFTFRHLTIKRLSGGQYGGRAIVIKNSSCFNEITHSHIKGYHSPVYPTEYEVIYSPNTLDSNLFIHHNIIEDGFAGLSLSGTTTGSSSSADASHIIIEDNIILNTKVSVLASNLDSVIIRRNISDEGGIICEYSTNRIEVSRNTIMSPSAHGNIKIENCGSVFYPSDSILIVSNAVRTSGGAYGIGILNNASGNYVYVIGNSVNSMHHAFYALSSNFKAYNNIFYAGGKGMDINNIPNVFSDYNVVYTTSGDPSKYVDGYATWAAWQASFGSPDAHSLTVNPNFVSAFDLHIQNTALLQQGMFIGYTRDMDGELYLNPPTIGADEPYIYDRDIRVLSNVISNTFQCDSLSITPTFVNTGFDTVFSFNYYYQVDGGSIISNSYSDTLAFTDSIAIPLPNLYLPAGTHTIKIFTDQPNGLADENTINDTLIYNYSLTLPSIVLTDTIVCPNVSILFDAGPGFSSYQWSTSDTTQQISFSGTGAVSVIVTDALGCSISDTAYVSNYSFPSVFAGVDVDVCTGDSIVLNASGTASVYTWNNSVQDSVYFIPTIAGNYIVTGTDTTTNCSTSDTLQLVIYNLPIVFAGNDTSVCYGSSVILSGSGTAVSYAWNNGVTDNVSFIPNNSNEYIITGTDVNNCTNQDTLWLAVDSCSMVWPGDANNDGMVDYNDLLDIGLHFAETGYSRTVTGITWQADSCAWWTGTQGNGFNLNFVDCDGDGIVSWSDTLAVSQNYSLTHSFFSPNNNDRSTAWIYFVSQDSIYPPNTLVEIDIYLGSSTNPLSSVYGVGGEFSFTSSGIQTGSLLVTIDDTSWLGINGSSAIRLNLVEEANQKFIIASSGTDLINKSGYGKIGSIQFITADTSNGNFQINLINANAIDNVGNIINLNSLGFNLTIDNSISVLDIGSKNNNIQVYPNPTNGNIIITGLTDQQSYAMSFVNSIGEICYQDKGVAGDGKLFVNPNLAAGVYILRVENNKEAYFIKVIIQD